MRQREERRQASGGSGPGVRTTDGSPVELYRLLKPQGEPEIIRSILPHRASLLELGCGVGRITHPLVRMGFQVVAVDNSPDMLRFVRGAETVTADIEGLNLNRKFDAVLLMSHLIHTPDASSREAMLATCRRHLAPEGRVIVQRHDPEWLARATEGFVGNTGGPRAFLDRVRRRGTKVEMTIRWEADDGPVWTQSFSVDRLDGDQIDQALGRAGLKLDRWLDERKTWFLATVAGS